MGAAQVVLQRRGLRHRRRLRQRHQHDARVAAVLQPHHRRDDVAARGAFEFAHHLPVVGAGGVHQQQRVAGRRRVEHDEGAARFADDAREGVEDGDLLGARGFQVFAQQRQSCGVQILGPRRQDLVGVALRLGLRVDAVHAQAVELPVQRRGQVGGRVGGAQVDGVAALHEGHGERGGDGRLADPALAHHHDQPAARRGEVVDQIGQRVPGRLALPRLGHRRRRPHPVGTQQGPQRRQPHRVERPQRHLVARQRAQHRRHRRQRLRPLRLDRQRHRVVAPAGVEHTVDRQPLVPEPEFGQFHRRARRLGDGARLGPRDEHHRGQRRIAQRLQRLPEAHLLHLQPRMRPEAGRAAVVAGQETGPRLRQAEQAQRVAGRRGVEDDVVEALAAAGQQRGELVERGDLGGAGARELLAHRGALGVIGLGAHLADHAGAVGLGRRLRIDVEHRQARRTRHRHRRVAQRNVQHLVQVGRRVRAHQQHPPARIRQRQRAGRGQRGLAHAALAGEEQVARRGLQQAKIGKRSGGGHGRAFRGVRSILRLKPPRRPCAASAV